MRWKLLIGLFFFVSFLRGQDIPSLDSLVYWGRQSLESPVFAIRDSSNQKFLKGLKLYLSADLNYLDPLTTCTNMLRLESPDERFAIYTWQRPDEKYRYQQFGLIAGNFKGEAKVIELKDQWDALGDLDFKIFRPQEWPGAIYYTILPVEGEKYEYLLLGLNLGETINQKVIEVLSVDKRGKVRFGAKRFKIESFRDQVFRKAPMRLILKYNAKYSATMRWNEDAEMVIMDHLAPPEPKMKGLYQMYGPDFSYDGLYWEDDWYHLKVGVDFNTGQKIEIKPPSQPLDLPKRSRPKPDPN